MPTIVEIKKENKSEQEIPVLKLALFTNKLKRTGRLTLILFLLDAVLVVSFSVISIFGCNVLDIVSNLNSTELFLVDKENFTTTLKCFTILTGTTGYLGIYYVLYFYRLRKKGFAIYEEITEDIDWSFKRREIRNKPPREARILIKEFIKSSDLPLTSGPNGQALYIMLFAFLATICAFLLTISFKFFS